MLESVLWCGRRGIPPIAKNAMDGALGYPTHRKERDGWGTWLSHPSQRTRWIGHLAFSLAGIGSRSNRLRGQDYLKEAMALASSSKMSKTV